MPDTSWSPPAGPPNDAPVRAADARREIAEAIKQARRHDRALRDEIVAVAASRVQAADALPAVVSEADEVRSLAQTALRRANDAARSGQRADAGRWTGAARVFALRLRDARRQMASLEQQAAAAAQRTQQVHTALSENVGRLEAVVAARLPVLSGRKARRARKAVDEVVAAISAPIADLVAQGAEAARAATSEVPEADDEVVPVADDELEREVDLDGADAILDELRDELGFAPAGAPAAGDPEAADAEGGGAEGGGAEAADTEGGDAEASEGEKAEPAAGGGAAGRSKRRGGKRPVPVSKR